MGLLQRLGAAGRAGNSPEAATAAPPRPAWWTSDDPSEASFRANAQEEADLVAAALERRQHHRSHGPGHAMTRSVMERYASRIVRMGRDGKQGFLDRLAEKLAKEGISLPQVTVEYRDLCVEADALVGTSALPSLSNVAIGTVKRWLGLTGLSTKKMTVLKNVTGVLKPGTSTLLLGPPGAGKTVYMQVLAGRLKPHAFLRTSGSVRYNGKKREEVVIERTTGYVDQYDDHIPSMTVHETLEFAHTCQNGLRGPQWDVPRELAVAKSTKKTRAEVRASQDLAGFEAMVGSSLPDERPQTIQEDKQLAMTATLAPVAAAGVMGPPVLPGGGNTAAPTPAKVASSVPVPNGTSAADALPEDDDAMFEKLLDEIWGTGVKTEIIIRLLGLANCADTQVGSALVRGVSGGERKRVTSGEILVGPKHVLLMDEISTGLDSATTFSVIQFLVTAAHTLHNTTVVSLLQPAPEVYNLFDDVLLLTDGQVCFHGPVKEALPFFATIGFTCPVRKDPASFLQEVTTPKGQRQFASEELLAARGKCPPGDLLVSVQEVSDTFYKHTSYGQALVDTVTNHPFAREKGHPRALQTKPYALGTLDAIKIVTRRQIMLTLRNAALVRGRLIQVVIMALIIGSLFSGLSNDAASARTYFGVSFLSVMFLSMGAMPQLAITIATRSVFYKQRDNKFFPPFTYAWAMALTQLPFALMEAGLFAIVVYFLVGYYRGPAAFFTFYLIVFCSILAMSSIFRLVACVAPNMVIANAASGVVLLVLVITSGFAIVRTKIPGWWIWAYYISPFSYALRAIVINEMTSPAWSAPSDSANPSGPTVGQSALLSFGFFTDKFWIWVGVAYLLGTFVLLTTAAQLALTWLDPEKARPVLPEEKRKAAAASQGAAAPECTALERLSRIIQAIPLSRPSRVSVDAANATAAAASVAQMLEEGRANQAGPKTALAFQPITLVYRDLRYYVDLPKAAKKVADSTSASAMPGKLELLKGITGYAEPGVLTALMGGSGAGKTTLMDVIAGRKTQGIIKGDILVNGHPKQQRTWARVVGYVEQNDIHSPAATVYEALMFSARLRLPRDTTDAQVAEYVDQVVDMVELGGLVNTLVGIPMVSGLSVEQRKRLTIAVELVANPSVVFMDEPTSGLDARAAAIVMRAVSNVARNGRTVLVTIHQPSIDIFESFDALVLLQRGGRLTYLGSLGRESVDLVSYLEAVPGVAPLAAGYNPATWMLEVTGGSMATFAKAADADFPSIYQESALAKANAAKVERLVAEGAAAHAPLAVGGRYAASARQQMASLVRKYTLAYWRSPAYNVTRLLMTTFIALFYGTMYLNQGTLPAQGATIADVQSIMGLLYSATQFQGMFNLITVMPVVSQERAVFYRERAASMYSSAPFAGATAIVELPYLLTQACIFVPIAYWLISFQATAAKFFFFFLVFSMSIAMFTFFGQLLAYLTPNQMVASVLAGAVSTLWSIFNGFMIPYTQIPRAWKWMNRISPTTWIIYTLAASQLGDNFQPLTTPAGEVTTASEFMESYFGYKYDFRWWCVLIVAAYLIFFRVSATLAVKYVSFQKR